MADLSVKIGGLKLKNPVMTASGTFGYGLEFADFVPLDGIGGIIVKGTTLNPREGNDYPRMAETSQGMLNCVGLQNKGVDYFCKNIYPQIKDIDTNMIVNVSGSSPDDYAERAFQAIKKTQTVSHKLKSNWENYMKYGYLPTDLTESESVSSSLESMYDDYCATDMARLMGKKDDEKYFARRSQFYKNLFDKQTQFMRPRMSDGSWKTPFDPSNLAHAESIGGDYTEGNAWQYTWQVQHDIPGLIKLFGGEKPFLKKLDQFFTLKLDSKLSDVTGLIGQYAHGNEPSHHVAYLYALAGRPSRTQELIREIFDTQYRPTVDGLCGNDDCGQMSAWYMLSAMGFYPVNPVSAQYVFGAPQMKKITVHLQNGKTFTVIADGLSEANKYVESITLNGKKLSKNYIDHAAIMNGGTLVYKMTSKKMHDKH